MGDFAELTSGCEYATRKRHCCDFRADMHSPRVRAAPRPCMLEPGVVWLASNCHGKARRAAIERKNNSRDLLLIVSGGGREADPKHSEGPISTPTTLESYSSLVGRHFGSRYSSSVCSPNRRCELERQIAAMPRLLRFSKTPQSTRALPLALVFIWHLSES